MLQSRDTGRPQCAAAGNRRHGPGAGRGVAEAYSTPAKPLRTGIVSIADESFAILTFGGILAAVISSQKKPAKVETSLLGAQVRMMGRTLTTTMWRDKNPVTGQARILTAPLNDLP
jgi:crotonobetainyl-CoA:carnitine CoA-transferase CaiB-like acyl-CoA transferase